MIPLYKKEKEALYKIHLLTGIPYQTVKEVFEGLLSSILLSYLDKEPIYLPLFGDITIKYLGDKETKQGRIADIDIDFEPSNFLLRVIGQIEDGDENDLEKHLKEKIFKTIEEYLI